MADAAAIMDAVGSCASGAGTLLLAALAIDAAKAWREQMKGTSDYQLARRILVALYRVKQAVDALRRAAVWIPWTYEAVEDMRGGGASDRTRSERIEEAAAALD